MPSRIEDYAVIGNCETLALVARNGSIDWLGFPRFDSPACFSALLGDENNGRWRIAPASGDVSVSRRYCDDTLILETVFRADKGAVRLTDFMSRRADASDLIRIVRGIEGEVTMRMELIVRFGYGCEIPWVTKQRDGRLQFVVGPDRLLLSSTVQPWGEDFRTLSEFTIKADEEESFVLTWSQSFQRTPPPIASADALARVKAFWTGWASTFQASHHANEAVLRSLLTLKALAHWETGGIVAAGTTSLPEKKGGSRNWDYRYCWLRDATFTLLALIGAGFLQEAKAWHRWLLRAVAGSPDAVQTMYGVAGERRLNEYELPWLSGYEGSKPVRVGNAAVKQLQIDVYGELLDAFYVARKAGLAAGAETWALESAFVSHLEQIWREPDDGIWEVRSERKQFTHSKVMAWVAFDRAVRSMEEFKLDGPLDRWRRVRSEIHDEVCAKGFNPKRNAFVQFFGGTELDAGLLLIPLVGFLPPDDPRVRGTIEAVERELLRDGFVLRYDTKLSRDGLPSGEGAFLACSFWLADNYALIGRKAEAQALFDRLLGLRNDVGLMAEEYDPVEKRQLGNFPQAFSHLALVNTARNLGGGFGPAELRSHRAPHPKPKKAGASSFPKHTP